MKKSGAFQHEVDAQFLVRQVRRIALRGHADMLAVDDQVVALGMDIAGVAAVHAVAAEQPGVRLRIRQIVDRDEVERIPSPRSRIARATKATDAAESVDRNLDRHRRYSLVRPLIKGGAAEQRAMSIDTLPHCAPFRESVAAAPAFAGVAARVNRLRLAYCDRRGTMLSQVQ